jgi:hypothetical protein
MTRPTLDTRCDNCIGWVPFDHIPKCGMCTRLSTVCSGFACGVKMTKDSEWCSEFKKGESDGPVTRQGT